MDYLLSLFQHPGFSGVIEFVLMLWPIWLPLALFFLFLNLWMDYKRLEFVSEQEPVLLEIRLPQEVYKSPRAMEIVIMSMYQSGGGILTEVYLDGAVKPYFSLELISQGGKIRFFIWTWPKYKSIITHQIYAQYPDVEIVEAEDYAQQVVHNPDERFIWGVYFKLQDEVLPLRTYKDYGLDKDPKEENKIDPMVAVLEYLGSLSAGEQAWYQILIQAHAKSEDWTSGELFPRKRYNDRIDDFIKNTLTKQTLNIQPQKPEGVKDEDFKPFSFTPLKPGIDDFIKQLEGFKSQFQFETIIRGFYIAENEYFNNANISAMIGSFRQYSYAPPNNSIKLAWWTDFRDNTKNFLRFLPEKWYIDKRYAYERDVLKAYKLRSWFQGPYKDQGSSFGVESFVMTTEELATLFHIPGGVAQTPTISRIDSKKAEPPSNLPL